MAFVPITDLKEADKLWEAGLLWFKHPGGETPNEPQPDNTYKYTDVFNRETARPTYADYVDYFILVED